MPPRAKKPSKDEIKRAADRAERKTKADTTSPLDPPVLDELEELDEVYIAPDGTPRPRRKRHPGGRPSLYKPEYAKVAKAMFAKGATAPELAELFGVTITTIWNWRNTHQDFFEAFIDGGLNFDERVEKALGERAVGYVYDDVKVFQFNGEPVIVPIKRHMPADVNAAKFWLAARQSGKWRVKEEVEISASGAVFSELWKQLADKKDKGGT